jgi:hypothetical protein
MTTTAPIELTAPTEWASDTNYAAGPDTGTATKVDPGSGLRASGVVPAGGVAAQHMNYELNAITKHLAALETMQRVALGRALALTPISSASTDTSEFLAALSLNDHIETVIGSPNSGGVFRMYDSVTFNLGGTLADITSEVTGGVIRGTRYIFIGTGTNQNDFSVNNGDTWTAGGSTGLLGDLIAICDATDNVVVLTAAGGSAFSTNAVAWTAPATQPADTVTGGGFTSCASLLNDVVVAVGLQGGHPAFARSTTSGHVWSAASGSVPAAASMNDAGWVVSTGSSATEMYHAGHRNVKMVDISVSTDGNTWTLLTSLDLGGTVSEVKLMQCPRTGLLVLAALLSTGTIILVASVDLGRTWGEPYQIADAQFALTGFSVAAGRVYATHGNGKIVVSNRIL